MNPLLSSSIDYEEYLKGRLQAAAAGAGSSSRRVVTHGVTRGAGAGPGGGEDGGGDFAVSLQHSWRGHVRASVSEKQPPAYCGSSGKLTLSIDNDYKEDTAILSPKSLRYSKNEDAINSYSSNDKLFELSTDDSSSHHSLSFSQPSWASILNEAGQRQQQRLEESLSPTPNAFRALSPTRRSIRIEDNRPVLRSSCASSSFGGDEDGFPLESKVHSVRTKRFFRKWRLQSRIKARHEEAVRDHFRRVVLRKSFARIKSYYLQLKLNTKATTNLLSRTFAKWQSVKRVSADSTDRTASKHYYLFKTFNTMRKLKYNVLQKRAIDELMRNKSLAKRHYDCTVLRKIVTNWRFTAKKLSSQKAINSEHINRLEKIKSLVQTIGGEAGAKMGAETGRARRESPQRGCGERRVAAPPPYQPPAGKRQTAERAAKDSGAAAARVLDKQKLPPRQLDTSRERTSSAAAKTAVAALPAREAPVASTAESLDERSRHRREKVAVLRRQAEERVAKRTEHETEVQRARLRKEEDDILLKVREERALKCDKQRQDDARIKERAELLQLAIGKSDRFYRKQLLVRRGLSPWVRLMELCRLNRIRAKAFYNDNLLQGAFVSLYAYCQSEKKDRSKKESRQSQVALLFRRKRLLRMAWRGFLLHRRMLKAKAVAVTGHFSRFTVRRRALRAWRIALERTRRALVGKVRAAAPRGDLCSKRFYYRRWQDFLQERLLDREVAARTQAMMSRVKSWL